MTIPIKTLTQDALNLAWDLASDIVKAVDYHNLTSGSYDPATGTYTKVENVLSSLEVFWMSFDTDEVDGQVVTQLDRRVLLRVSDAPNLDPTLDDWMVADGDRWNVIAYRKDATEKLWTFQVRKRDK